MTCNTSFSLVSLTWGESGGVGAPQVPLQDFCRFHSWFLPITDNWGHLWQMHPESCKHTVPFLRTKAKHKQHHEKKNHKCYYERSDYVGQWNKKLTSVLTVKSTWIVKAPLTQSNMHYVTVWRILEYRSSFIIFGCASLLTFYWLYNEKRPKCVTKKVISK